MRVSEKVTIEEINKWKDGDIITIEAGTGSGKSYFIKNNLYAIAKRDKKRILMLIHRINCVNQFQYEITQDNKMDVIDIKTYQSIDSLYKRGMEFNFEQYDYLIMDEFHYFLQDSSYNKYTDLSLEAILKQSNKTRIFMSATGDYMTQYINRFKKYETINYSIPNNFSFIKQLRFFYKNSTLENFIAAAIENNIKSIFFIESAEKAYKLHEKFKEYTLFNCAKNNKKFYQYVDPEKINNMLKNERFEELILITTTVMDAGVNIIDSELKNIVVDVRDTGTLIQCIGRKRLENKDDYINLYVKAIENRRLGGFISQANKRLTMARYFTEHGEQKFVKKYYRQLDRSNIVYDEIKFGGITKRRNDLMYFKSEIDVLEIEAMLKFGKYGYCEYIESVFNIKSKKLKEEETGDDLEAYLESLVGLPLDKEKRKELIEIINLKDGRGRTQKSVSLLNAYFKENKMKFMIVSKTSSTIEDGKKKSFRFWEIIKDVESF